MFPYFTFQWVTPIIVSWTEIKVGKLQQPKCHVLLSREISASCHVGPLLRLKKSENSHRKLNEIKRSVILSVFRKYFVNCSTV